MSKSRLPVKSLMSSSVSLLHSGNFVVPPIHSLLVSILSFNFLTFSHPVSLYSPILLALLLCSDGVNIVSYPKKNQAVEKGGKISNQ